MTKLTPWHLAFSGLMLCSFPSNVLIAQDFGINFLYKNSLKSSTQHSELALLSLEETQDLKTILENQLLLKNRPYSTTSVRRIQAPSGRKSEYFRLSLQGTPLCTYPIAVHLLKGNRLIVNGIVPEFEEIENIPEAGIKSSSLLAQILSDNNMKASAQDRISKISSCYAPTQNKKLSTSYEVFLTNKGKSYRAIYSTKYGTISLDQQYFDLESSMEAYNKNPIDGEIKTFSVETEDGTKLINDRFITMTNSVPRAIGEDGVFSADHDSAQFREINVFAHANRIADWFSSIGYIDTKERISIVLNSPEFPANNGQYQPKNEALGNMVPAIFLDQGDGVGLRNLTLDSDVVSHEYGHHIVFATMKSTRLLEYYDDVVTTDGEAPQKTTLDLNAVDHSLSLHEALADFFMFQASKDPCLGESICPEDSNFCYIKGQCLRTAESNITYLENSYRELRSPHLKSQVISGMLWDIKKTEKMEDDDLSKLVLTAVDFLKAERNTYGDFVLALLAADADLYDSKNSCLITEAAENRGLKKFYADKIPKCDEITKDSEVIIVVKETSSGSSDDGDGDGNSESGSNKPEPPSPTPPPPTNTNSTSSQNGDNSTEKPVVSCATMGVSQQQAHHAIFALLLTLAPILGLLRRKK